MQTISRFTITLTATLAGGAGLLTACGDDAAEALSKADFVAQADAICQETQDRVDPIFEAVWADTDDVDWDDPANELLIFVRFDEAMDDVMPIMEQQLTDLRRLVPPREDEELIDELLDDQEAALTEFADLVAAAAGGDQAALARLDSEQEDPFEDIDRRARDYGLQKCGEQDE